MSNTTPEIPNFVGISVLARNLLSKIIENVLDGNLKDYILAVSTFHPMALSQIFYCTAKYTNSHSILAIFISPYTSKHCISKLC